MSRAFQKRTQHRIGFDARALVIDQDHRQVQLPFKRIKLAMHFA